MKLWLDESGKEVDRPKSTRTAGATDEMLQAEYPLLKCVDAPDCPRKYWVWDAEARTITEMSQDEKDAVDAADAAAAQAASEQAAIAQAEYLAGVDVYPRAIEAPVYIVHSEASRKGVGITSTDDAELVTYIAHESPYDHAAAEARRLAAVQAANERKAQRVLDKTAAKGAGTAAASANSVPALRAEVARLAAIIERLCQ